MSRVVTQVCPYCRARVTPHDACEVHGRHHDWCCPDKTAKKDTGKKDTGKKDTGKKGRK